MSTVVTPENKDILTHFTTTRWSLIRGCLAAKTHTNTDKRLSQFCQTYWHPIFAFICRRGYSTPDAQDLTQDFFVLILEGTFLQTADPNRGRFRSFLITSLRNFLIDIEIRRRTQKRGGDLRFVSWEDYMANPPQGLSICKPEWNRLSEDALFDLTWAAAIAQEALRRLRIECESKGRRDVFDVLHHYLESERGEVCYGHLSIALGVPQASVKRLLHKFRTRYRGLLREEVSKTVENSSDVDDEIRYLCATLSARGS
jgi:DNA-directed RNA polymerase specialized sigma24 family protein